MTGTVATGEAEPRLDTPPRRTEAHPKATRRTLGHQPALDGLRGLAVAAVVLYHLGQANDLTGLREVSQGGFLGVSAFLTLSGFLITTLLILEFESIGHISLGGFWGRRFRRLMPASLFTLAAVAILTPLVGTQNQLRELPGEIWASLGYVANWKFIVSGSDYAATFNGAPSPLKHFWSLAVEEQAYFILPFVVAVALRFGGGRRRVVGTVFAAIVAIATLVTFLQGGGEYANAVYMGTHTRIAELAVGGLLAVMMAGRTRARTTRAFIGTTVGGPLALGMIVAAWATTDLQAPWLYRGGLTVHAIAVAVVIAAALQPATALQRILAWRPFTELGRVSYGVYLFHWPVLWWVTPSRLHLPAAVAAGVQVLITLGLAYASYHLIEQPIRTRRLVVSRPARLLVPVAAVAAVAVGAAYLPKADTARIVAMSASKDAVIPTTKAPRTGATAPPPPVRILVVGDSFALSVGLGLEHLARDEGTVATLNTGLVGCGFGRGGMNRGIGLEREWPEECQNREADLALKLASFRPDVVLCSGGMWDLTDRKLEGETRWTHIGEPDYDAYLAGEFRHLTEFLGSGGATVVWTTAPTFDPQYNPESYMGKPPYAEADPKRSERYNEVLAESLSLVPNAKVLDLAGYIKDLPGGEFDPELRIDRVHFSEQGTDLIAQKYLGPFLVEIGREVQENGGPTAPSTSFSTTTLPSASTTGPGASTTSGPRSTTTAPRSTTTPG